MNSEYDSESPDSEVGEEQSGNLRFIEALSTHKVLFDKSQLPLIRKKKENSLIEMQESYQTIYGKSINVKQLKKKIQNMKNELKKKTDMKATGNKKIVLKDWEKKLLDIIDKDDKNPTMHKIPGAAATGLKPLENMEIQKPAEERRLVRPPPPPSYIITPSKPKKNKLEGKETDETAKLCTADLQRIVLLEQLKLTRMQIEREQLLLDKLRQNLTETQGSTRHCPESEGPESEGAVSEGPETSTSFDLDKIYTML